MSRPLPDRLSPTILLLLIGCTPPPDGVGPGDSHDTASEDSDTDGDSGSDSDSDSAPDTDDPPPPGAVTCAPALSHLVVTGTQSLQLTAEVATAGGPIPATGAAWMVISGPGTVDASGLYRTPADHGGLAKVQATKDGRSGVCTVEVEMDGVVDASGSPGVPGAFAGATPKVDDGCASKILYPLADSAMPGSFAPPMIQWSAAGANMHELVLTSEWTTLSVYTSGNSFTPTIDQWSGLTRFDPGATVSLRLTSGTWSGSGFSGGTCTATRATDFEVTDDGIGGTIVYWAPPITKSVSFDASSAATNAKVNLPGSICHGCHTVNLAKPMRMTYGPDFPGKTNLVDLSSPGTVLKTWGNGFTDMKDYAAPDPTGTYVVISGMAVFGGGANMKLYNQNTGAEVAQIHTARSPTMPNWSPDGTKLVYAGCDSGASALGGAACDLYVQTWNAGTSSFGTETRIAEHPAGTTLYYPSFSPDSKWIAYNRAEMWTNAEGEVQSSNANPRAKVMLVSASGGPQIVLGNANGVGELTNSWPRWAPSAGTYAWLAYSTKRAYGHQVDGRAQLWVTGVDLAAAAAGSGDPSQPPAWIPGQLISEGNHTPTWLPRFKP